MRVFAAEAAPAFIVRAAGTGAFGAVPDIVLSGINRGPNTGHAVLHSGTVIVARVTPLVLNVNAPNCPPEELRGIHSTRLAAFGAVQTSVTEQGSGYVKLADDEIAEDLVPGTDAAALAACTASVTSLHAVCEEVEAGLPDA
ncbi:MAG TPA: 5'/3'-nucleotidase SurE, partial [Ilumatobacteraceae bacterium]|nr:5'/3'-nucleotidase SurE [Ilumatobacteraceae bacterium]